MKKLLFTFSVGFLISLSADAYISEETEYICPDPVLKYQKLEGWGSSLCWWAAQVGKWDDEKIDAIVDALTSPDQLNMNIFRYNIGGGDDPSHADGHMVKGKGKRAEMEGFKSSKDADYNWNADAAQRKILLKIKDRRKDAVFEAFSNSAPYWMTYSGCSAGNDNPLEDNLKPEYYELFCRYLVDVCQYYKEHCGIEFKTLEPFNESFSNYWYNLGSQEGCHFEPETQMTIIRILYPMLQESGLPTVISASDETNLNQFLTVQKSYREAGDIIGGLDCIHNPMDTVIYNKEPYTPAAANHIRDDGEIILRRDIYARSRNIIMHSPVSIEEGLRTHSPVVCTAVCLYGKHRIKGGVKEIHYPGCRASCLLRIL